MDKKVPPWRRGDTTAALLKHSSSPERGIRLPHMVRIRRGTGLRPDVSAKTADDRDLAIRTWRFKGANITIA